MDSSDWRSLTNSEILMVSVLERSDKSTAINASDLSSCVHAIKLAENRNKAICFLISCSFTINGCQKAVKHTDECRLNYWFINNICIHPLNLRSLLPLWQLLFKFSTHSSKLLWNLPFLHIGHCNSKGNYHLSGSSNHPYLTPVNCLKQAEIIFFSS